MNQTGPEANGLWLVANLQKSEDHRRKASASVANFMVAGTDAKSGARVLPLAKLFAMNASDAATASYDDDDLPSRQISTLPKLGDSPKLPNEVACENKYSETGERCGAQRAGTRCAFFLSC